MSDKKLRIIPLGGLGEVGKNMMAYEYGKNILIVDTGLMFPENDMLGIDYIVPDFEYLMDKTQWVYSNMWTPPFTRLRSLADFWKLSFHAVRCSTKSS